jgi:hypothetical protein
MRDFQEFKRSTVRYWEMRRLYYNLLLVLPALFGFFSGATAAARHGLVREYSTMTVLLLFALLAVPANICYTFSYSLEFLLGSDSPDAR